MFVKQTQGYDDNKGLRSPPAFSDKTPLAIAMTAALGGAVFTSSDLPYLLLNKALVC